MTKNTVEDLQKLVRPFDPKAAFWFAKDGGPAEVYRDVCLPEEFWQRDCHADLRQAAWHHMTSPDVVLNAALTELSACIPPTVRIDTGIYLPVPLHRFGSIVGPSGSGKSTGIGVGLGYLQIRAPGLTARGRWGVRIPDGVATVENDFGAFPYRLPLGTGAGLCEAYYGLEYYGDPGRNGTRKSRRARVRTNVLLFSDEGHDFVKACHDPKSNIADTVRSMWSGSLAGQGNANAEARRILPGGCYTVAFLVGLQEKVLADFLTDDELIRGTPQRFVHTWAVSPDIPETQPDHPGRPTLRLPTANITVCKKVAEAVRCGQHARATGRVEIPELEAQRTGVILRDAGLLSIFDGRTEIGEQDWQLAEMMLDTSSRIVEHCQAKAAAAAASKKEKRRLGDLADSIVEDELMKTPEGKTGIHILSVLAERPVGTWVKWTGADGIRSARLRGNQRIDGDKALDLLAAEGLIAKKDEGATVWLKRQRT